MPEIYERTLRGMPHVESVGDSIFYIESHKNPLPRLIKKGKAPTQMLHTWSAQVWEDFPFKGVMDGVDKTGGYGGSATQPLSNCMMWMESKGYLVSRLAKHVKRAGVKDEVAKQISDDAFNFARQLDRQMLSAASARIQTATLPYQSGGIFWWLDPAQAAATPENGLIQVPASFRNSADMQFTGKLSEFTEEKLENMLRVCAEAKNGQIDLTFFVGSALKRQMSLFTKRDINAEAGAATQIYQLNGKEKKLSSAVDFFEFDAGSVRTIMSFNMACDPDTGKKTDYSSRSGAALDLSMWELCWFEETQHWSDNTKSGGPRGHHDGIFGLKCGMPFAQPRCWIKEN